MPAGYFLKQDGDLINHWSAKYCRWLLFPTRRQLSVHLPHLFLRCTLGSGKCQCWNDNDTRGSAGQGSRIVEPCYAANSIPGLVTYHDRRNKVSTSTRTSWPECCLPALASFLPTSSQLTLGNVPAQRPRRHTSAVL